MRTGCIPVGLMLNGMYGSTSVIGELDLNERQLQANQKQDCNLPIVRKLIGKKHK